MGGNFFRPDDGGDFPSAFRSRFFALGYADQNPGGKMILKLARPILEIREVLLDPAASGPNPAYWVFTELGPNCPWVNLTLIPAGFYGREYPKSFGHFHGDGLPERFCIVSGQGLLILQKEIEPVGEVLIVKAGAGETIAVSGEYGHAWVNTGHEPLIIYDDRKAPHPESDYEPLAKHHGLACYLLAGTAGPEAVPNSHYQNPPVPVWLTAEEYRQSTSYPR
jgi:hypothetical protein